MGRLGALRLLRRFSGLHRDQRGQIVFTVIPLLLGFFILAALSWDAGVWFFDHRTAQNQVDASALAAVQELPSTQAVITGPGGALERAEEWLDRNGVAGGSTFSDFVSDVPTCEGLDPGDAWVIFGNKPEAEDNYYTVRVCVRRDSLVLFTGLIPGITEAIVSASGRAAVELLPLPYALMAMDPTGCRTLEVSGSTAEVTLLDDGESYTASAGPCSGANRPLSVSGSGATFEAAGHDVCSPPPHVSGFLGGPVDQLCGLPDPWIGIDPPLEANDPCISLPNFNSGGTETLDAGTYCGLSLSAGTALVLTGGVYVFKGDFKVTGTGSQITTASETLIYMTCPTYPCEGANSGSFDVTAAGVPFALQLDGHESFENIGIYVDRTANDGICVSITGQGNLLIDANIYAWSCEVRFSGGADAAFELNGTIVANEIDFGGGAQYNVTWNAEFAPKLPSYALVD